MNGKTTATAGGTDRIRDALRFDMNTLSPEDISGAFIRITQAYSGTATGSGATSLTDSTAPFPGANGLTGALVAALTSAGAVTVLTITSDSTTVLTGTGGWSNGTPSTTSTYVVSYGYVGKVLRLDTTNGDIYFDPAVTTAIVSGTQYELVYHNIRPDEYDESRDFALTQRCSPKRTKPLSIVADVESWPVTAYSATTGGVTSSTAASAALDFPDELFTTGMTVTNSGSAGLISSEMFKVQPTETYRVFGRVSVNAQTASVRVRDLTNGADITLTDTPNTWTLNGWQWFDVQFTIPTGCGRAQIWLGGSSASCIATWAGVGCLPTASTWLSLSARILSKHDVGRVFQYQLPTSVNGQIYRDELQVTRDTAGDGVTLLGEDVGSWPVYYQERHHYSALQSDYLSAVNRVTGSAATTDCNLDYIAWATVVELLEARKRNDVTDRLFIVAEKNLRAIDRQLGFDPLVAPEFPRSNSSGIAVMSL